MLHGNTKSGQRRGKSSVGKGSFVKRISGLLSGKAKLRTAEPPQPAPEPSPEVEEEPPCVEEDKLWPAERIELVEKIWGEGFITPGGADYMVEFIQLLALDEKKSILYLGNGLGGPGRAMCKEHGVWVDGREENKELVEVGQEKSLMAGMSKKAPVDHYDPENIKLKENAFNGVVSLASFYTVADKENLYNKLADSLRVDGFLLFTDLVSANDEAPNEKVLHWSQKEPLEPHLWSAQKTAAFLNTLLLETHITEDITPAYKKLVLRGWFDFVSTLTKAELTPDYVETIINECKYWVERMAALDSGGLRMYRFEAVKLPKPRV